MLESLFSTDYDKIPLDLARLLKSKNNNITNHKDMAGFIAKILILQEYDKDNTRNYDGKKWTYVYKSQISNYLVDASDSTVKRFIASVTATGYIERIVYPKYPNMYFRLEGRGSRQPTWYSVDEAKLAADMAEFRKDKEPVVRQSHIGKSTEACTIDAYNYIVRSLQGVDDAQLCLIDSLAGILLNDAGAGIHCHMSEITRDAEGSYALVGIDRTPQPTP